MPSVNRIDSIYDVAAIAAEQKRVEELVRASIEQIKTARSQSINFNVNTKSIEDYNKNVTQLNSSLANMKNTVAATTAATVANTQATQQTNKSLEQNIALRNKLQNSLNSYKASIKEDTELFKAGTITQAEFRKRLLESQVAIEKYKARIAEVNTEIKNLQPTQKQIADQLKREQKAADDAGNEYKQLSAAYNEAALKAKNYNLTLGANHPTTIQATKDAKAISDQLKAVDASVGQTQRNVGNYGAAIKDTFGKAFSFLKTAANIIPGLGISGLILGIVTSFGTLFKMLAGGNDITEESAKLAERYNKSLADSKGAVDGLAESLRFLNEIGRINLEIDFGEGFELADLRAQSVGLQQLGASITTELAKLDRAQSQANQDFLKNLLTEADLTKISEEQTKRRGELLVDQNRNAAQQSIIFRQIELQKNKNAAEDSKKEKERLKKAAEEFERIQEANRKAQFDILKAQIELDKEFDLIRASDDKRTFVDRLTNLISYGEDSQRLIEEQAKFELGNAKLTSVERQKIEHDKNNALIRLSTELGDRLKKIAQDDFKTGTDKLPIDPKIPKELQKILDDFSKAQKKAIDDAAENAKKLKEALKGAFVSLASELEGLFFDIFTNAIEAQKNAVQDQIDLLEQQKQKDIEVANQTITNASDRADAIAVIEARAAAKKQQLELKQRQLDQQKARFEKARAVTEIVQNTSIAVVKALGQFPGPVGIALAAVIGALGAVQIARVLAQPIPRYKDGTENHPGGLAVVGDGGKSETVVLPDGSLYRTPSKDTLVNLPAGTKVIPDYQGKPQSVSMVNPIDNTAELRQGFASVVYAVKRIPQPIIKADRAWTQAHKIGSSYRNYLNRSI